MVAFWNPREANRLSIGALHVLQRIRSEPLPQIHGTHLERRFYKGNDDSASLQSDTHHYEMKLEVTVIDTCPNPKLLFATISLSESPEAYSLWEKFPTSFKDKGVEGHL